MILILGANGQNGSITQKILFERRYKNVICVSRKSKIQFPSYKYYNRDLIIPNAIDDILLKYKVKYVFNFAADSFVDRNHSEVSNYSLPSIFCNIIDSLKNIDNKKIWLFHPISSEIFGIPDYVKQNINTKINPINVYGASKAYELIYCRYLNSKSYKIFHPILYNHESKFRDNKFFTKKIISSLLNYGSSKFKTIEFYNAHSSRDFGSAIEYCNIFVDAMEKKIIGDEIIGTGISIKIIQFITEILNLLEIEHIIKEKDGLIKIFDKEMNIIASEISRDLIDSQRKFCFDGGFVNNELFTKNLTGGSKFIKNLINEFYKK